MHTTPTDIDAFSIPPFSTFDGIFGVYADDERVILDMWSPWHAERVNVRLPIARARLRAAEWQVADVTPRGDATLTAQAQAFHAAAQAELKELEMKRDLLEASRVREGEAPEWRWV